jgi:SAM-dependent methyltransferase
MSKGEEFDRNTQKFFNDYAPEYPIQWFSSLLNFAKRNTTGIEQILDVGCGAGNILALFKHYASFHKCIGIDISDELLKKASSIYNVETYQCSILDKSLSSKIGRNFNYIILGQMLHHLVGSTRNISKNNVRKALLNAFQLLKPGGYLLILEPTYSPSLSCAFVFWVKRILSSLFPKRIDFFKKYHNLGLPVVSFLTQKELLRIVEGTGYFSIIEWEEDRRHVSWLMRLGLIQRLAYVSCIAQKIA